MALEGRIIEFLDSDRLRLGYVRKEERNRLHVIDPRGRNLSVSEEHIVIVHNAVTESEFPVVALQVLEQITALQSEVDVELLWQSLDGNQRQKTPAELARMFFADERPEAASAVFRALSDDNLYFRRKGSQFFRKAAEQVSAEITRRNRQREREATREQLSAVIRKLLKDKNGVIAPEAAPVLDRIQNWLRYKTGDEVAAILEEIAGPAKARDAAYDILRRAGRVDPSFDRFLVMAGIEGSFSKQLLEAVEQLTPYTHEQSRIDHQDVPAFTIDDEDTLEVDDALTIQTSGSEIVVGVHIADVSAFVGKGDLLDAEASRRSSTIYLPTITVRMFPERLSTDLVSLNAGSARPAFTVEVRFDQHGNRLGYRIALTTIRVQKRMSYDEADHAIDSGDNLLQTLHSIAKQLQNSRAACGAITFRRPELKIRVQDDEIKIQKVNPNSPSRFLVSEMMILANGLAADFASVNAIPVIYRTQEPRDALTVEDVPITEALAFERLRKTFKRSRLSLTPAMHSGLGLGAYTQASSPIRRYADLVTQRQFTAFLRGAALPHVRDELLRILTTAEAVEQEVRAIEDRSTNYWLLEYLSRYKKNESLSAVILDTKGNIELEDYYLRAKVIAPTKLQPGDRVHVQIGNIDPGQGEVRFKAV